jgi:hypothetical protein
MLSSLVAALLALSAFQAVGAAQGNVGLLQGRVAALPCAPAAAASCAARRLSGSW